ncbi:kinase-like domain-containing protein [Lasiosphaeria hispida]|uniref:Kinase-like domain-containing protein n=1 Tax=Lasiosphaeria hispida TaxID=260671 RepID=A0AAJ0HGM1_9PEZI|nr:kinase-like domain-containing protein [Lasiosphaeria hispida]
MATRPTLPYFAPPESLPAPLPRIASILASTRFFPSYQVGSKVVHFNQYYVVKYGTRVRLQEGENMLFVRQATNIRVPTVYALFYDEKTSYNFIIQEYIPGRNLLPHWETLDESGKEAIVAQLRQYFDQLRSLPSPGYFGGVWGQRTLDLYLGSGMDASKTSDEHKPLPCATEKEWVDNMIAAGKAVDAFNKYPNLVGFFGHAFHTIFQGHRPVFSHTDLHPTNVLICDDGTVALIDWGRAGWYPSFWEYCCLMAPLGHDCDFDSWIPRFLDEYLVELGWMYKFREWILISCL